MSNIAHGLNCGLCNLSIISMDSSIYGIIKIIHESHINLERDYIPAQMFFLNDVFSDF